MALRQCVIGILAKGKWTHTEFLFNTDCRDSPDCVASYFIRREVYYESVQQTGLDCILCVTHYFEMSLNLLNL